MSNAWKQGLASMAVPMQQLANSIGTEGSHDAFVRSLTPQPVAPDVRLLKRRIGGDR